MGIFENTVLVDKKISPGNTIGKIACIIAIVILLILSVITMSPIVFVMPVVAVAVIFYFLHMGAKVEYEYTYIEGRLSFAKIIAKRKRKELADVDMESLLLIAPENAPELHNYHNGGQNIVCKDYTSGMGQDEVYEVVHKYGEGIRIIRFEPDHNMMELMQRGNGNLRKIVMKK